jgi:hypothetical protein
MVQFLGVWGRAGGEVREFAQWVDGVEVVEAVVWECCYLDNDCLEGGP